MALLPPPLPPPPLLPVVVVVVVVVLLLLLLPMLLVALLLPMGLAATATLGSSLGYSRSLAWSWTTLLSSDRMHLLAG